MFLAINQRCGTLWQLWRSYSDLRCLKLENSPIKHATKPLFTGSCLRCWKWNDCHCKPSGRYNTFFYFKLLNQQVLSTLPFWVNRFFCLLFVHSKTWNIKYNLEARIIALKCRNPAWSQLFLQNIETLHTPVWENTPRLVVAILFVCILRP